MLLSLHIQRLFQCCSLSHSSVAFTAHSASISVLLSVTSQYCFHFQLSIAAVTFRWDTVIQMIWWCTKARNGSTRNSRLDLFSKSFNLFSYAPYARTGSIFISYSLLLSFSMHQLYALDLDSIQTIPSIHFMHQLNALDLWYTIQIIPFTVHSLCAPNVRSGSFQRALQFQK